MYTTTMMYPLLGKDRSGQSLQKSVHNLVHTDIKMSRVHLKQKYLLAKIFEHVEDKYKRSDCGQP